VVGAEARLRRLIQVEPAVPQAEMEAGPTILLCPHFVCLDVAGVASRVIPVCVHVCAAKEQGLRPLLRYGRERFGPVRLFTRKEGIKPILRALRDGLPYFMLPDMDFGEKDAPSCPSSASRRPP
jgi:KDO2-lipid IV(A) lauroyltransferase